MQRPSRSTRPNGLSNGSSNVPPRNGNGNGTIQRIRASLSMPPNRSRQRPINVAVRRRTPRRIINAAQDTWDTLKRALNRPVVVLILLAVVIFWIDHNNNDGFIHRKCSNSTTPVCKWVLDNFKVVSGLVIFLPALYDLPSNVVFTASALAVTLILLLPPMEFWVYACAAFALHTYFTSRIMQTRLLVIVIAVVVFLLFR